MDPIIIGCTRYRTWGMKKREFSGAIASLVINGHRLTVSIKKHFSPLFPEFHAKCQIVHAPHLPPLVRWMWPAKTATKCAGVRTQTRMTWSIAEQGEIRPGHFRTNQASQWIWMNRCQDAGDKIPNPGTKSGYDNAKLQYLSELKSPLKESTGSFECLSHEDSKFA